MMAKDARDGVKNRYGVVETVGLDIKKAGNYAEVASFGVWTLQFSCETAQSMGVYLSTFDIPNGAKLFVYSADKKTLRGAFTARNNPDGGGFAIAEIKGGSYVLEYNEPLNADFQGGVIVESISKAYLSMEERAVPARVGINCPEGANYQLEKRAVARMQYFSGSASYWCSGSLVNNASYDGTPYFLSANHCISSDAVASTLITYFNYENSNCSSSDASDEQTISGATLKATSTRTDFLLLLLNEMPPSEYQPYFLGWDATGEKPTSGAAIHHPMGTPKCISIDQDTLVSYADEIYWDNYVVSVPHTHWQSSYEIGADEGGSSGSPMLNQNYRIVGQLHGGTNKISLWGKFSLSWDSYGSSNQQLKHWLDPENTGLETLDGLDYYTNPAADLMAIPSPACTGSLITLHTRSSGSAAKEWSISPATFSFAPGSDKNSKSPQVFFQQAGNYTISCEVRASGFYETFTLNLKVSDDLQVVLKKESTNDGGSMLEEMADVEECCGRTLDNFVIAAEGAFIYRFEVEASEYFTTIAKSNKLILQLNEEGKRVGTFDTYVSVEGKSGTCSSEDKVLLKVSAPINDNVASAAKLHTGRSEKQSNVCGSVESNEPYPADKGCDSPLAWCPSLTDNPLDNSVWYTFVAPSGGSVEISLSGIANQFAVYAASSSEELLTVSPHTPLLVAAADNFIGAETKATLQLQAGMRYFLQVDGKDGAEGEFDITLKNSELTIYPTASTDGRINIVLPNFTEGRATISVYDIAGSQVYQTTADVTKSQSAYQFDLGSLRFAFYLVKVEVNGAVFVSKIRLLGAK